MHFDRFSGRRYSTRRSRLAVARRGLLLARSEILPEGWKRSEHRCRLEEHVRGSTERLQYGGKRRIPRKVSGKLGRRAAGLSALAGATVASSAFGLASAELRGRRSHSYERRFRGRRWWGNSSTSQTLPGSSAAGCKGIIYFIALSLSAPPSSDRPFLREDVSTMVMAEADEKA